MPFKTITEWLAKEKEAGSENPARAVLATVTANGIPHSRVVAVREVKPEGIVFFTQRGTRKVIELTENNHASMTFWFVMQQREIILDGYAKPLSIAENKIYWSTMSWERQLSFSAYAPTSNQAIDSLVELKERYNILSKQFASAPIPMSEFYCGFCLIPQTVCFYTLGSDTFSEVKKYSKINDLWNEQLLSP